MLCGEGTYIACAARWGGWCLDLKVPVNAAVLLLAQELVPARQLKLPTFTSLSQSSSDSSVHEIVSQLGLCPLLKMKLVSFNSMPKTTASVYLLSQKMEGFAGLMHLALLAPGSSQSFSFSNPLWICFFLVPLQEQRFLLLHY